MLQVKDYKIKWRHEVYNDSSAKMDGIEKPLYKANTMCCIKDSEGRRVNAGIAHCSWKDNMCYDTGRKISLKKTLAKTSFPKQLRKDIWEGYRTKMTNKPRW